MVTASRGLPLSASDRRLHKRVQELRSPAESVRAAAVVFSGPRPGIEVFFRPLFGVFASLINKGRTFFTIAATERGLIVFRNSRPRRRSELVARLERFDALGGHPPASGLCRRGRGRVVRDAKLTD